MSDRRKGTAIAVLLLISLEACAAGEADRPGQDAARAFFEGKTMTYIVATDAGGGYDTYGRLVSRYLGQHLGLRDVVVKNVPGGGHVKGANEIAAARPDGLTLGVFNSGLIYSQLIGSEALRLDLQKMSWIGKAGSEPRALVVSAKSGIRSFDDVKTLGRPLLLGCNGYGSEGYQDSLLLAHFLGHDVRFVFGLATRPAQLSMMRGEIDGHVGSVSAMRDFVKNGYGSIVLRVGDGEGLDEEIADARDLVTTSEGKAIVGLVETLGRLLRWTSGPPGIPEDRLAVLRKAYMAALQDPALLAEASKMDIPIVPMDGASVASEVKRLLVQPPETIALLTSIINEAGETSSSQAAAPPISSR